MQRCSTALAEEALSTYTGHSDPVYCVHWNRRHPDIFLSTSADWTLKLWLSSRSQVREPLNCNICNLGRILTSYYDNFRHWKSEDKLM